MITHTKLADQYILNASRGGDTSKLQAIKTFLTEYKAQIDYNMNRFIEDFGHYLDVERNDKFHKFAKIQNEEYAKITRLERVMHAYGVDNV
jgi:hypothetical protein